MAGLLETYETMVDTAESNAQQAEIQKEAQAEENERLNVLTKYASAADGLLAEQFGEDYEEADVIELAEKMINHDVAQEQSQEKVAEYVEAGQVMARAFIGEINNSGK